MGYADDIESIILAYDIEDARRKLNQVMITTHIWLKDHGLELAKNTTEVIIKIMAHILLEIIDYVSQVAKKAVK